MKDNLVFIFLISFFCFSFFACKSDGKDNVKTADEKVNYPVYAEQNLEKLYYKKPADTIIAELDSFFKEDLQEKGFSGGMLIAKDGNIIYEKYLGFENFEKKKNINIDSKIHLASISKVLTALAILKLVEGGRLELKDPVKKFLPSFIDEDITVENLLSHRSGLQNYAYFKNDAKFWKAGAMKTNEDVLAYINQGLDERTGEEDKKFNYSNTNFALLALIIEKLTGDTYAKAMKNIVFKPLKMKNTYVFNITDSAKVSQSYTSRGERWKFMDLDKIVGDKNIYSTPRDLLRLDKAMYSENFLSPAIFSKMKKGYSYESAGVKNYGLGLRMREWDGEHILYYHNGWWHGNYTVYVRDEKNKITLIALGNKQIRAVYDVFSLAGYFGNYPLVYKNKNLREKL